MRVLCFLLAGLFAAGAQPESNLSSRFTAMGKDAAVKLADGSLALTYQVKPGQLAAAVLPAPPAVAHMGRLRLRVKADHGTAPTVVLSEKKPGGGNYSAVFWAPANAWQQVELTPGDFSVSDGPRDPVDADGKLDLDAVEGIAVFDAAPFFAAMPDNPDVPVTIHRASGAHTLLLDDFRVLPDAAPPPPAGLIDAFDRGFLPWITLGGLELSLSPSGNPLGEPAMQVATRQLDGEIAVLTRRVAHLDLSKATRLAFDVASQRESTLAVTLEQKDGQRYNLTVYPPGKQEVFRVDLKLEDFNGQAKVAPGQLKSIAIADLGGPGNTMWIANVRWR
jgi:hypothetical protein